MTALREDGEKTQKQRCEERGTRVVVVVFLSLEDTCKIIIFSN